MAELGSGPSPVAIRRLDTPESAPVFALSGELDLAGLATVRAALEPVLAPAVREVVFLCEELTFMDSSGLVLFLEIVDRGVSVTLRSPTPAVRNVIEATGLQQVVRMTP